MTTPTIDEQLSDLREGNTFNSDDFPSGSYGGYDRHGNFIIPDAMKEIVLLRARLIAAREMEEALDMLSRRQIATWRSNMGIVGGTYVAWLDAENRVKQALAAWRKAGEE